MRNRIECREAAPDFAHVPPPTLRVPVFDCREDPAPPVVEREYPHAVRPPHHVGRRGDDPPVVGLRGALTPAVRGEQSVRPHDAQHPRAGDADPVQDPKPGVDLAMAFAVERGPREIGPNRRQQLRVRLPPPRRSSRSSSRPPHRQREALLRGPGPLAEQRDLHRQLPDVPLRRVEHLRHGIAVTVL